jgi:hypothetical protein
MVNMPHTRILRRPTDLMWEIEKVIGSYHKGDETPASAITEIKKLISGEK